MLLLENSYQFRVVRYARPNPGVNILMKNLLVIFSLVLFWSCHDNDQPESKTENTGLYTTDGEDQEMNQAIKDARISLVQFDESYLSGKFDTSTFALKVRFPTETGGEHIWATSIVIANGAYYGVIDDVPVLTTHVSQGDRIKINKEDITDWMYSENGVLRGGYSIRLIRQRLTKEEKLQFDLNFRLRIEEEH
jgi:uncharacterized protein YegJ (DUF2314 family)